MQIGSTLGTGVKALAFAALDRFDTLNSLVDRMSGGSINRDTLARKVLRDAVHMGLEMQFASTGLGERSAALAPLAGKILFDNNASEMYASIKDLTHQLVLPGTDHGNGVSAASVRLVAAGLAEAVAQTATETQFTEKLLATMFKQHSFQPLEAYMEKSLAGLPFKGFAGDLVKNLLQRGIVDQPGLDQSERPVFRLLASLGNAFLSDENYQRPLGDYFKQATAAAPVDALAATVMGVGQAAIDVAGTAADTIEVLAHGYSDTRDYLASGEYLNGGLKAATTVTTAAATVVIGVATGVLPTLASTAASLTGITARAAVGAVVVAAPTVQAGATTLYQGALSEAGRIYDSALGPPAYRGAREAYGKEIDQAEKDQKLPALPPPDARTSDSQWANALVQQQSIVQFALPDTDLGRAQSVDAVDQAFAQGQLDSARRANLLELADQLSPEQLAPLGPSSATRQVAHNVVSGNLSRLAVESRAGLLLSDHTLQAMAQALAPAPATSSDRAGYRLADSYAAHVGQLALDFPEGIYTYADASKDNLQGAGNLWWGESVTLADRAELRKLYNICGGNEVQMFALSGYLDPALALQALSAPVLAELDLQGQGRLQLREPEPDGLQLTLADRLPACRYQLRREGENVQLTISATWDIAQYGTDAQQLRSPQGKQSSELTSSITITVPPSGTPPGGAPPGEPALHSTPTLECAIRNEFQFGAHGQLELPAAAA